eukprot:g5233.t1
MSPTAQTLLLHPDLKFVIPEYLEPQCRFNARIALQHNLGWIPKQVLEYVKGKREKGERLQWNYLTLAEVVKGDNFVVVKWVVAFNDYVKGKLCDSAAEYDKLHMLKWARKQQPPLKWDFRSLNRAYYRGHYDTMKWVIESGCPYQRKTGFLRYVRVLEDEDQWKNIVVNQVINRDGTTLMNACYFGHLELVRHLLGRNGVNVNMKSRHGDTGLLLACKTGKLEVVKLLLQCEDIDVNVYEWYRGFTALHEASKNGDIEIAKEILSHRKFNRVNKKAFGGDTAYDTAKAQVTTCLRRAKVNGLASNHASDKLLQRAQEVAALIKSHSAYVEGGESRESDMDFNNSSDSYDDSESDSDYDSDSDYSYDENDDSDSDFY